MLMCANVFVTTFMTHQKRPGDNEKQDWVFISLGTTCSQIVKNPKLK